MDIETKIYINNDLDIVMARMQTRQVAKKMGFSTADQARISLAASELARLLSWTMTGPAEIVITPATKNGHQGLQVMCLVQLEYVSAADDEPDNSQASKSLAGALQLVDESNVEAQNDEQARVTLIKWLN